MGKGNRLGIGKVNKSASVYLAILFAAFLIAAANYSHSLPLATVLSFVTGTALALAAAAALVFAGIFGGMALFESWLDNNIN